MSGPAACQAVAGHRAGSADRRTGVTETGTLNRHVLGGAQQMAEEHAMRRRLGLGTPQRLTEAVTAAQGRP
ncbi:hypothetical protein ABZV29_24390 [Streptomyces sp. NPDC005236]|uniref:hypothetical protein n=1 Tax=Streptomyces sp. NPDC005236 TaxID=3157028 RepID=UPI0033A8F078